ADKKRRCGCALVDVSQRRRAGRYKAAKNGVWPAECAILAVPGQAIRAVTNNVTHHAGAVTLCILAALIGSKWMADRTAAKRQRALRERMKAKGWVARRVHIRPEYSALLLKVEKAMRLKGSTVTIRTTGEETM